LNRALHKMWAAAAQPVGKTLAPDGRRIYAPPHTNAPQLSPSLAGMQAAEGKSNCRLSRPAGFLISYY
jgi:hypothetical protein